MNLELHLILAGLNAEVLPDSWETELFVTSKSIGNVSQKYIFNEH